MKIQYIYIAMLALVLTSTSCKDDDVVPPAPMNYSYLEEFDSLSVAFAKGWSVSNKSEPLGNVTWSAGGINFDGVYYGAYSSNNAGSDCIFTSISCTGAFGIASNWLISPPTKMKNGDQIEFFTRSATNRFSRADRMQIRLSNVNDSRNIGSGANSVGDFSTLLLDINPTLIYTGTGSYPKDWTKYTITISGLPAGIQTRHFAFRYYVPDGGTGGAGKGFGIGVDQVAFVSK
jgi:hypothetical protein